MIRCLYLFHLRFTPYLPLLERQKAARSPRIRQNSKDASIYRNISRSTIQREIKGIDDKLTAGWQKISINETGVQSSFRNISNVAQCIFYDIQVGSTYHIYNRRIEPTNALPQDIYSPFNTYSYLYGWIAIIIIKNRSPPGKMIRGSG